MLHLDLTLEDSRIVATRDESGKWAGISADNLTGKQAPFACSDEQIGAVVALAFGYGEENIDSPITAASRRKLVRVSPWNAARCHKLAGNRKIENDLTIVF